RQHVVVTGLGAVTPVGVGVAAYTRSLRAGVDGVRAVAFDDPRVRTSAAAECVGFDPSRVVSEADARRLPRLVPMALRAAREACAMAGLPEFTGEDRVDAARRVGLVLGTGGGGIDFTLEQAARDAKGGRASLWTLT